MKCLFCERKQTITADLKDEVDYFEGPYIKEELISFKILPGRYLHIRYFNEDEGIDQFLNWGINYCPLCGRKLHNPPEKVTFEPEEV